MEDTQEWEPPQLVRVLSSRLLEGDELAAELDRVEKAQGWRPSKVQVREVLCSDGSTHRQWRYR